MARKNFILCVLISTLIMLVLPWLAVTFVKSDAGIYLILGMIAMLFSMFISQKARG